MKLLSWQQLSIANVTEARGMGMQHNLVADPGYKPGEEVGQGRG